MRQTKNNKKKQKRTIRQLRPEKLLLLAFCLSCVFYCFSKIGLNSYNITLSVEDQRLASELAKTQDEVYNDSSSWGNCSNYNEDNPDRQVEGAGEGVLPAGTSDYWCANNIYDLAGNAYDWTQEASLTVNRVRRGGYYGYAGYVYPASGYHYGTPGFADSGISARAALYVK